MPKTKKQAARTRGTEAMTLRFSRELADDEGRVFVAYAPPRTLMVMGRTFGPGHPFSLCLLEYWRRCSAGGLILN